MMFSAFSLHRLRVSEGHSPWEWLGIKKQPSQYWVCDQLTSYFKCALNGEITKAKTVLNFFSMFPVLYCMGCRKVKGTVFESGWGSRNNYPHVGCMRIN